MIPDLSRRRHFELDKVGGIHDAGATACKPDRQAT
jgi:hypothetical protein